MAVRFYRTATGVQTTDAGIRPTTVAELIWAYRETISIICQSKVSLEVVNEVEGIDDYAERAETQEKCGIYLEAFTLALSEWRHALTGERSAL